MSFKTSDKSRANNRRYYWNKGRNWRLRNKDRVNAKRRAGYRKWYLVRQYGITPEDYDRILASQGNRCAICKTNDPQSRHSDGFRWHVDHCHKTNRVRGLLCFRCNVGIGHLGDDPLLVQSALDYLLKN